MTRENRPDVRGAKTSYNKLDSSKYNVTQYMYPIDLLSPKDSADIGAGVSVGNENYVVFYINVSEDSKLVKLEENRDPRRLDNGESIFTKDTDPRRYKGIRDAGFTENKVVAASTGQVVGAAVLAGGVASILPGPQGLGIAGVAAASVVASKVGAAAISTQTSGFTRAQRRLKTAIALHIPNNLATSYGVTYSDEDTDTFQLSAKVGQELVNAYNKGTINKGLSSFIDSMKNPAASVALKSIPGKDAISNLTGLAVNPKKEQVFRGVEFRSFTMDYEFFPRNSAESTKVLDIIYQFKYHMHPEFKGEGEFLYVYPSEFDISYYRGESENKSLHTHTSCVLTNVDVNYTPNGVFTTFKDGTPTQINMTLHFRELMQPTKDSIAEFGL